MDQKTTHREVTLAGKTRLHRYGIERFFLEVAGKIAPQRLLLDGGAGNCKHGKLFPHAGVVARDVAQRRQRRYGEIDVAGDLHAIPCRDSTFDAIINAEVIEHLAAGTGSARNVLRIREPVTTTAIAERAGVASARQTVHARAV